MVKKKEDNLLNKYENQFVEDLIPYARNARQHDEKQVAQIASSIKEFGFLNPVLIDKDNGIIAGHGRVLAAHKLKMKHVPCLRIEHLTETQKKAYILADNRLAEKSTWDNDLLKLELEELDNLDFDLDLIGFDGFDNDELKDEFEPNFPRENQEKENKEFKLIVTLNSEDERESLFQELKKKYYKVKAG